MALPTGHQKARDIHFFFFSPFLRHCQSSAVTSLSLDKSGLSILWDGWNHYGWVLFQLVHYTNRTSALWVVYMLFLQCVVGLNYIYRIYTRFTFSITSVHQCFNSGTVATISMATSYYGMGIRLCVHPV